MTNLEMIKRCAEKMDYDVSTDIHGVVFFRTDGTKQPERHDYDPLHDDAQAMALVKKFELSIAPDFMDSGCAVFVVVCGGVKTHSHDLNRAIVECVAKMEKANG